MPFGHVRQGGREGGDFGCCWCSIAFAESSPHPPRCAWSPLPTRGRESRLRERAIPDPPALPLPPMRWATSLTPMEKA